MIINTRDVCTYESLKELMPTIILVGVAHRARNLRFKTKSF
jgi:hypothetical protein